MASIHEACGLAVNLADQGAGQLMAHNAPDIHARDELGFRGRPEPSLFKPLWLPRWHFQQVRFTDRIR
ncbi:MAG: hypothetical protein ABIO50_01975 [Nitrosospira sp.]